MFWMMFCDWLNHVDEDELERPLYNTLTHNMMFEALMRTDAIENRSVADLNACLMFWEGTDDITLLDYDEDYSDICPGCPI